MNIRFLALVSAALACVGGVRAADEPEAPKTNMREVLRARMAEDAKKQPMPPSKPKPKENAEETAPTSPTATASATAAKDTATTPAPAPSKPTAQQPATVMPKVEVRKGRITELDQKLAKQEEEIAREKKNTKPSEVDLALNDAKIAKPLSIFGGESAQFRKRVSSERVELMEEEKDLIEAIARAKTKQEKAELQKQLDELRTVRRELEKSLR